MKNIRHINVLIALFCTVIAQNALSMHIATALAKGGISSICTGAELLLTTGLIISNVLDSPNNNIGAKSSKDKQSEAPETITSFIKEISTNREIADIKVVLNDNFHDYSANVNDKTLNVPTQQATELELLIGNKNRSLQDEKKLNKHMAIVHHELTHIERNSPKRLSVYNSYITPISTIGAIGLTQLSSHIAKRYIPQLGTSFVLRNAFKIGRGFGTLALSKYLMDMNKNMNLYNKYEELKTDDGVPQKKELLEPFAEYFESHHAEKIKDIISIKENYSNKDIIYPPKNNYFTRPQLLAIKTLPTAWFNKPLIMDCVFHATSEHPSDLRRALRIRDRIKHIENIK